MNFAALLPFSLLMYHSFILNQGQPNRIRVKNTFNNSNYIHDNPNSTAVQLPAKHCFNYSFHPWFACNPGWLLQWLGSWTFNRFIVFEGFILTRFYRVIIIHLIINKKFTNYKIYKFKPSYECSVKINQNQQPCLF